MITEKNIGGLISSYNNAVDEGKETFTFAGTEILTKYAKYVIEYANLRLNIGSFDGRKFYFSQNKVSSKTL